MKPNMDNVLFVARTYTKLAIIRGVLNRTVPHGNAGKRVRDRVWKPYRESFAERTMRDEGGAISGIDKSGGIK